MSNARIIVKLELGILLIILALAAMLAGCNGDKGGNNNTATYSILQKSLDAGYYCTCWNQRAKSGQLVSAGTYQVHFKAGLYDTLLPFVIIASEARVTAPECCDSATGGSLKEQGSLPDIYGVQLNDSSFSSGDSLAIDFALPVQSDVKIEVERH